MAIPEAQLSTWSHQGSITQSSSTYNTIKRVLEDPATPYAGKGYTVYLQGSYRNDTNIYAESDVDIVIQLTDVFDSDLSRLSEGEKSAFEKEYPDSAYGYTQFKRDVVSVLSGAFLSDVVVGNKAVHIKPSGARRKADVIPALSFRRYHSFKGKANQSSHKGMSFFTGEGKRIANYPKQHSDNLTTKHQSTGEWLKPLVRVLKNLRTKLQEKGHLSAGAAPSYYIEGLLYNVPDDRFGSTFQDSFVKTMTWVQKVDKRELVCANELYYLIRDDSLTSWPVAASENFLRAAVGLWNNW